MFQGKTLKYLKAEVMEEFSKDKGGKCMNELLLQHLEWESISRTSGK